MPNFNYDQLRLTTEDNQPLSVARWNSLVDQIEQVESTLNRIHLTAGGKVGIGTSEPMKKLHVKSNGAIMSLEGSSHSFMEFYPKGVAEGRKAWIGFGSSTENTFYVTTQYKDNLALRTAGKSRLLINKDGDVGIGTTTPSAKLHVNGLIKSSGGGGGIMFPDGIAQKQASKVTLIKQGSESMHKKSWDKSPLNGGKSHTSGWIYYKNYGNSSQEFINAPTVIFSIYHLDCEKRTNTRIDVSVVSISRTRFKIRYKTWSDSKVYQVRVRWTAIGVRK